MYLLGIDYGRVYLGLAVSHGYTPYALKVIKSKSDRHKIQEIVKICKKENISKIIIGKGSGKLEATVYAFVNKLKKHVKNIVVIDETLTSYKAINQMVSSGIPKKKRKTYEHAYAAAILLSLFLEQEKNKLL